MKSQATTDAPAASSPAADVRELEQQVDAIRDELGDLVGELDRRRHRAAKPIALVGAAVAISGFTLVGLLRWRRSRADRLARQTVLGFVRRCFEGHDGHRRS